MRHARGVDARGTSRAGVVVRAGGVQALGAFHDAAPFARLPRDMIPKSMEAVMRRLNELAPEGSSQDPEVGAARVSLLAALTAVLAAKGAPAEVTGSISPAPPSGTTGASPSLADVLPARCATPREHWEVTVRRRVARRSVR